MKLIRHSINHFTWTASLLLYVACFSPLLTGLSAQVPAEASMLTKNPVPVIELNGDPYNRGVQHGTQLKNEIAAVFAKWKTNIRSAVKGNPDSTLSVFLQSTDFKPAITKYTPGILQELKGIADGSGQSFNDVYAFQLVDEFWVYLDKQFNTANHHCSGIGVAATVTHPAYIAQNMDLEDYMQGFQVLLHLSPGNGEPEQYILSCAGLVALNGMNGAGIGLCMNTLMELQASADGLPVAFIVRGVLSKLSGNEALAFLKSVKHASGQNYILGITDSVYDFEASSNQVIRFFPKTGDNTIVYHTNHAIANHDVKTWYKTYHQQVLAKTAQNNNSSIRFASLDQRLNKNSSAISADVIKTTLRSKDDAKNPVCRPFTASGSGFTFSSVLFTLSGKRSVQLTNGSPDQSDYKEFFFSPAGSDSPVSEKR
jgi:isopenicillin-N N-acyltransferase like protein